MTSSHTSLAGGEQISLYVQTEGGKCSERKVKQLRHNEANVALFNE